ncbi:hypothetical protein [Spirillospora sp. CA-294931]|uniref:hypothetical protein n=1 Tax=Spirillospora sp. CA-294931 TaxID=3240042 RepID=UPI003D8CAD5E
MSSIIPSRPNDPERRTGGGLQRHGAAAPLHRRGAMDLSTGQPLRQECWDAMGQGVRDRLLQRAGNVIEWWATQDGADPSGRSMAVVFGDRALCVAEPRVNTEHKPVYALVSYVLDPGSFKNAAIDHRPLPAGARPASKGPSAGPAAPDLGLDARARGILGNLPPKAQELLQAPFLGGQRVLRCDWYYEGREHQLSMFMLYLAGARDVTVATGTKVVPVGHTEATAHWSLTCRRASVVKRVGA